jgi:ssDNA-binding Zn-finger/Zn-ribbon topoisomerase 1
MNDFHQYRSFTDDFQLYMNHRCPECGRHNGVIYILDFLNPDFDSTLTCTRCGLTYSVEPTEEKREQINRKYELLLKIKQAENDIKEMKKELYGTD